MSADSGQRKTRTVVVARSIGTGAPSLASAGVNGPVVGSPRRPRDEQSGKLIAYAALGAEEDIDRFDRFLVEQEREAAGDASPTKPSKRPSYSRSKPSSGTASSSTTESGSLEADSALAARKRREAAVARRQWLTSLPIHERLAQQRQEAALRRWEQVNRDWTRFQRRAARKLGKPETQLVMSRAAAYREQVETLDALQKARPLADKVGNDVWLATLRGEGTRFVPVGNIFSGLFCPIRESSRLEPQVRRPLDRRRLSALGGAAEPLEPVLSSMERRSLELLERKKRRLRKRLDELFPHQVQQSSAGGLVVDTTDLFVWASAACQDGEDDHNQSELGTPLRLPPGFDETMDEKDETPEDPQTERRDRSYVGPSLRVFTDDATDSTVTGEEAAEDTSRSIRLGFFAPVGEQQQRCVAIENDGSTVVHFQWWRAPFECLELTPHLSWRESPDRYREPMTTSVSSIEGSLLPGEMQSFWFSFEASKPGTYLEKWLLSADPPPRISLGHGNSSGAVTDQPVQVEVTLNCTAIDNFVPWRKRRCLRERVEKHEAEFFIRQLVDDVLDGVNPHETTTFAELTPAAVAFANEHRGTEFEDVYYSPQAMAALGELYASARGIVESAASNDTAEVKPDSARPPPTENDGDDPGAVETTEGNEQVVSALPLPDPLPVEWDGKLETLSVACRRADIAQYRKMSELTRQLMEEKRKLEEEEEAAEEEEDDDEDDDEDEEEEDEEEDDDEDDDSGGSDGDESSAPPPPPKPKKETQADRRARKALERQNQRQEREDRCNQLLTDIAALRPRLQDAFLSLRLSASTAPYSSVPLRSFLTERLLHFTSETPVVYEIATGSAHAPSGSRHSSDAFESVRQLLTRAIDEAVGLDQDRQERFERDRRRFNRVWLPDKSNTSALATHLADRHVSIIDGEAEAEAHHPSLPRVVLFYADLDIAPWYELIKLPPKAEDEQPATDTAMEDIVCWQVAPKLLAHSTFVPRKVVEAANALQQLLTELAASDADVRAVIVVSELGRPPVTKTARKLLRSIAKSSTAVEGEQPKGDEAVLRCLDRLHARASLAEVAQILQRALGTTTDVAFCSTLGEFEALQAANSKSEPEPTTPDENKQEEDQTPKPKAVPQIFLLERVSKLAEALASVVEPPPPDPNAQDAQPTPVPAADPPKGGKKPAVTGKKPGAAAVAAPTPTPAPAVPELEPVVEAPPPAIVSLDSKTARRAAVEKLGLALARRCRAFVLDALPFADAEQVFTVVPLDEAALTPVIAGPTLATQLERWSTILHSPNPPVMTAIVGGKGLERKLRLIDSLLEVASTIFIVGEVALSLYRVLHSSQLGESKTQTDAVSMWAVLEPAVTKLRQKAYRKNVRLLLPVDFIVGESTLEEQDLSAADASEDEDDDEEELGEDEEDTSPRKKKKKSKRKKEREGPLVEPDEVSIFGRRQFAYDGEKAHVVLGGTDNSGEISLPTSWWLLDQITERSLSTAYTLSGPAAILNAPSSDDADEDGDSDEPVDRTAAIMAAAEQPPPTMLVGTEWTLRAFDIGPISTQLLSDFLSSTLVSTVDPSGLSPPHTVVVSGLSGAVEFDAFADSSRQLVTALRELRRANTDTAAAFELLVAGNTTAEWWQWLEATTKSAAQLESGTSQPIVGSAMPLIDARVLRNAAALKQLLSAKPHPILTKLEARKDRVDTA